MLKKVVLNGKRIPVPVPVLDLAEAIQWIQKHLVRPDHVITRVQLDGRDIDVGVDGEIRLPRTLLNENSDLRCKIDSPQEICLQTIDALKNLSSVVGRNLKPVAVQLWNHKGAKVTAEATAVLEDATLMQELLEHVILLLDRRIDATNLNSYRDSVNKSMTALQYALQHNDWQACAKVLLNQLEAPTLELSSELESLEKVIFEIQADRTYEKRQQQVG